jgi:hypothetical protein
LRRASMCGLRREERGRRPRGREARPPGSCSHRSPFHLPYVRVMCRSVAFSHSVHTLRTQQLRAFLRRASVAVRPTPPPSHPLSLPRMCCLTHRTRRTHSTAPRGPKSGEAQFSAPRVLRGTLRSALPVVWAAVATWDLPRQPPLASPGTYSSVAATTMRRFMTTARRGGLCLGRMGVWAGCAPRAPGAAGAPVAAAEDAVWGRE